MATQTVRMIKDQNLDVRSDVAPTGMPNVSKAQKKGGGVGGRKALNDISNSGKPSALQASKKHNSVNAISTGENLGASKRIPFGVKKDASKGPLLTGGRKALGDLTNSGNPSVRQVPKKSHDRKLSVVEEEQFLHDHNKCIKAQGGAMDIDYFLQTVGLHDDHSVQSASPRALPLSTMLKVESPLKLEEMQELLVGDKSPNSPRLCWSPESPKQQYMHWKDYEIPSFNLLESP